VHTRARSEGPNPFASSPYREPSTPSDRGARDEQPRATLGAVVREHASPQENGLLYNIGVAVFAVDRIGQVGTRTVEWRHTLIRADRFSVTTDFSHRTGYRMGVESQ
jgi:hypothetical protein